MTQLIRKREMYLCASTLLSTRITEKISYKTCRSYWNL